MWQWRFVRLSVGQMGRRGGCMWVEGRNQSFLTGCLRPLPAPRTSACTTCSTCACNSASCSTITEVQPHPPFFLDHRHQEDGKTDDLSSSCVSFSMNLDPSISISPIQYTDFWVFNSSAYLPRISILCAFGTPYADRPNQMFHIYIWEK